MKILLLSRYENLGASSRHRSYQYLPSLRGYGHTIDVAPLLSNTYVRSLYEKSHVPVVEVIWSYGKRISRLLNAESYDLVWVEYEALPWIPFWFESLFTGKTVPYVVDYDDAVFHRYDQHVSYTVQMLLGRKIASVMRHSRLVIAGNEYIAGHARDSGAPRVEIVPTAVDLAKYQIKSTVQHSECSVGWIGTPRTAHYLQLISEALREACTNGKAKIVMIGSSPIQLPEVPVESRPWSEITEAEELLKVDVGIMPLVDSPWERGKCGYKLLQYMACALPVVASPVGVNREIVEHGVNGYLASNSEEWIRALKILQENPEVRKRMGQAGRQKVERFYSTSVIAPRLARLLEEAAQGDS